MPSVVAVYKYAGIENYLSNNILRIADNFYYFYTIVFLGIKR